MDLPDIDRHDPPDPWFQPLVLIVDAHDETRTSYVENLRALGFDAIGVDDGAKAWGRACWARPDVIVTELTARVHDGWDLLDRVKGDRRTSHIPVVVLTRSSAPSLRDRAARAGCAAVVAKPCPPGELAKRLRQILDAGALLSENPRHR